ncbi:hypothetical protein Kpol_1028p56 [Vanderwaltozyma polyspora DSM 70294]|uniref:DM2 domain-containing protein n=1 Tax=Vanderwaltozyma polyspora (strain ATCC 22028 / DSM 70294 / BCRC 21397 / CBS 2163 / NBRC 10782 / NRRL Y-8283 / UCD 57-17) TaxID=436907 RepID=A7TG24_VANPO|nr:uncharacterized protein Kpol_1028p56 [Vanderwaltozyma polyspora DSM 70294]EDO18781.1 hypothetical protein Kpol_1028p56 [Vanderwaltozyma polyspora DSM 70294]
MSGSSKANAKNNKKVVEVANTNNAGNGKVLPQQINPPQVSLPTDSYIPSYLSELVPELKSYQQLIEAEKRLDVYLARKKIDLHQNVSQWSNNGVGSAFSMENSLNRRNIENTKYLRVFISNIAENQPWQDPSQELSAGSWTMRVEGRLLDSQNVSDANRPKFSSFFQAIAVDFKKKKNESSSNKNETDTAATTTTTGLALPNQNQDVEMKDVEMKDDVTKQETDIADAVEWHFDSKNPVEFDGLDIKRQGTENIDCTVTMQLKNITGKELDYSPELASIIGLSQGSLHTAVYSLYKYLLINKLLINDESNNQGPSSSSPSSENTNGEKTIVQLDEFLSELLPNSNIDETVPKPTTIKLVDLLPLINQHVSPLKPVKINYTIRVDKASTYGDCVFDLAVPNPQQSSNAKEPSEESKEGLSLLAELNNLTTEFKPKLQELDMEASALQLQLNDSASRYQFFKKISSDPVPVLQEYIASSATALKVLSGDEGYNEDTVRRSQFYKDNEAILFENLGVLLANGRM